MCVLIKGLYHCDITEQWKTTQSYGHTVVIPIKVPLTMCHNFAHEDTLTGIYYTNYYEL